MFGVKSGEKKWSLWAAVAVIGLLLSGCSSVSLNRAPVEDRGNVPKPAVVVTDTAPAPVVKPPPGAENAGKPGYYTVKPKDTLIAIGLENGASHKDIARWNNLENPNKIEIGQVLRVVPPVIEGTSAVAKPVTSGAVVATTVAPGAPAKPASTPVAAASAPVSAPAAPASGDEDLGWIWPSGGNVIAGFDEGKTKGIDIGGASGDPVVAAADGRVIWAAAGEGTMRHYGNLIIVQHNKTYLTAYANNSTLLVKEDQRIKKGQKIAEMGSTGTDRVKLHFELRRMGIAVDPTKYLPAR
jgi:lipoprotein NlpD